MANLIPFVLILVIFVRNGSLQGFDDEELQEQAGPHHAGLLLLTQSAQIQRTVPSSVQETVQQGSSAQQSGVGIEFQDNPLQATTAQEKSAQTQSIETQPAILKQPEDPTTQPEVFTQPETPVIIQTVLPPPGPAVQATGNPQVSKQTEIITPSQPVTVSSPKLSQQLNNKIEQEVYSPSQPQPKPQSETKKNVQTYVVDGIQGQQPQPSKTSLAQPIVVSSSQPKFPLYSNFSFTDILTLQQCQGQNFAPLDNKFIFYNKACANEIQTCRSVCMFVKLGLIQEQGGISYSKLQQLSLRVFGGQIAPIGTDFLDLAEFCVSNYNYLGNVDIQGGCYSYASLMNCLSNSLQQVCRLQQGINTQLSKPSSVQTRPPMYNLQQTSTSKFTPTNQGQGYNPNFRVQNVGASGQGYNIQPKVYNNQEQGYNFAVQQQQQGYTPIVQGYGPSTRPRVQGYNIPQQSYNPSVTQGYNSPVNHGYNSQSQGYNNPSGGRVSGYYNNLQRQGYIVPVAKSIMLQGQGYSSTPPQVFTHNVASSQTYNSAGQGYYNSQKQPYNSQG